MNDQCSDGINVRMERNATCSKLEMKQSIHVSITGVLRVCCSPLPSLDGLSEKRPLRETTRFQSGFAGSARRNESRQARTKQLPSVRVVRDRACVSRLPRSDATCSEDATKFGAGSSRHEDTCTNARCLRTMHVMQSLTFSECLLIALCR